MLGHEQHTQLQIANSDIQHNDATPYARLPDHDGQID